MNTYEHYLRRAMLAVLGLLVLHAPITTRLISLGTPEELTEIWKELALFIILLAITFRYREQLPHLLVETFKRHQLLTSALILTTTIFTVALMQSHVSLTARGVSAVIYGRIALAMLIGWLAAYFRLINWQDVRRLLTWSSVIVVVFGALQVFVLPTDFLSMLGYQSGIIEPFQLVDEDPDRVRILSTLRGPNPLGWFTALIGVFIVNRFVCSTTKKSKIGWTTLFSLTLIVLLASYSRSGLLAFVLAVSGYSLWVAPSTVRRALVVGGLVIVMMAGLVLAGNTELRDEYLFHDSAETANVTADAERSNSLSSSALAIARQPHGHGLGTAGSAAFFDDSGTAQVAESFIGQIGYELGLLPLVIFVGFLAIGAWCLIKQNNLNTGMVGFVLIAWLLVSLLAPVFTDDTVAIIGFWLFGFAATSTHRDKLV